MPILVNNNHHHHHLFSDRPNMILLILVLTIFVHSIQATNDNDNLKELLTGYEDQDLGRSSKDVPLGGWFQIFNNLLSRIEKALDFGAQPSEHDEMPSIDTLTTPTTTTTTTTITDNSDEHFEEMLNDDDDDDDDGQYDQYTIIPPPNPETVVKVFDTGQCETLNGSMGFCQPIDRCLASEPQRKMFGLCAWSENPVSGEKIPLEICCQNPRPKISNNADRDEDWNTQTGLTATNFLNNNHWNIFSFLPAHPIPKPPRPSPPHTVQCGQTLYNRNHRRQSVQHYAVEVPEVPGDSRRSTPKNDSKTTPNNSPRIVSGVSVGRGEIPWIVSIYLRNHFVCGGSLISDRHVLTAAHCFTSGSEPDFYYIRYGGVVLHEGPAVQVKRIAIHPGYNPPVIYHDIALMELVHPIQFSPVVQPVCLATSQMYGDNLVGMKATVSGFGDSGFEEKKHSEFLQAVDIKIIENKYCDQNYRRLAESKKKFRYGIGKTLICAGYEQGVKDACQGDSGGPLTIEWRGAHYQIGIVSFGFRCAQPQFPGIYTAVTYYRKWIIDNMQSHHH